MSKRVLIVDDSLFMRRMIGDTLAADGWEIAGEASDSVQAVEMYQRVRPDAVTLDVTMPGANGMTALRSILEVDPHAKIVVVSALSRTRLISEAIRAGAQDFIAKPFLPEQLQETLRACFTAEGS